MTTNEAFTLALAYVRSNGNGVTAKDHGPIVRVFNILADSGDEDDMDMVHRLDMAFSWVINNHDERGNYVGPVANENGWTA